jgi:diguanylate cyclase (GGDEF)-like protein
MAAVSTAIPPQRLLDRVLPLAHWLGAEAAQGIERGQAKTRLICTLFGLGGFAAIWGFSGLPQGIVATGILFPLYATAYFALAHLRPAPTHAGRGFALLMDNLVVAYIASFGDAFAAYAGLLFLTTVGWGLRFGRHYLFLATAVAILGMACNLALSPYWQGEILFGVTIIFGLAANAANAAVLLGRIAQGNRELAGKVEEIAQIAGQDQLTKLPNRLYFHQRLSQVLAAAERSGRVVALLLFDIDGFKAVNDTLGHEAGDRVLQDIAQRVVRRTRQADTFARLGGDEFVVLMEITRDRSDAVPVAEGIISAVAEIDTYAQRGLRLGASVGIACNDLISARERIADELLIQADRAMYEAKRAGKGCYRFALGTEEGMR